MQTAVSESRLLPLLADTRVCLMEPSQAVNDPFVLPSRVMAEVVSQWRTQIALSAKGLVKSTRSVLEELSSGSLYEKLATPRWKTAALICEVFRSPDVSKNAGWLATKQLQRRIVAALEADGPLEFSLAWGQAKREVGGLKVLGALPDLAEFYALSRLAVVLETIARHLDGARDVRLKILGGATRYNAALYTRSHVARAYDEHRAHIASLLLGRAAITVQPFQQAAHAGATVPDGAAAPADDIGEREIASNFATVALNVDWGRFFQPHPDEGSDSIPRVPDDVAQWLRDHDEAGASRLLRAAVTSTLNPRCRLAWERHFPAGSDGVLRSATEFLRSTAWESTGRYLRLQAAREETRENEHVVRLTVHEKKTRQEIPALYTLGPQGGDQLSQHVMAKLGRGGSLRFGPVAEFAQAGPVRPILVGKVDAGETGPAPWLAGAPQPLCVAEGGIDQVGEALAKAFRF